MFGVSNESVRIKPLFKANELSQRPEDKSLIKIKKYIALLVCEMSPCLLRECLYFQKGLKQPKEYFTIKKKLCPFNGSYDGVCLRRSRIVLMKMIVYMSSCRRELDCWKRRRQERDTGGGGGGGGGGV